MKIGNFIKLFSIMIILLMSQSCTTEGVINDNWIPDVLQPGREVYIPDYSFAGYKWGEESIPDIPGMIIDVTDYGVLPDDRKDDTDGLKAAFAAAHATEGPVIVQLPAGRIILSDILYIERDDFVLRGAGNDPEKGTVLYFPKSLSELETPHYFEELQEYLLVNDKRQREKDRGIDEAYSLYAWSGGFIWVNYPGERGKPYMAKYNIQPEILAVITGGKRGEHHFRVENADKLKAGQIVRINWYNREGKESSLLRYLYDDQEVKIGVRHWEAPEVALTKQEVMITGIDGDEVSIKEPLLHDLREEWTPDISVWKHVKGVGIEDIYFEFLYQEYRYHHVEYGFNAIYFTNATHSWARNLSFRNGDSGILNDLCSNITFQDINVYGRKYHYGVHFGDSYNMLAKNIYVQAPVVHSLTFNTGSRSCVYTDCFVTRDPTLDQHSGLNYMNLFDNSRILIDDPEHRPLTMGGAKYWAPSHAAFSTFWNISIDYLFEHSANDTIKIKGVTDSPSARLVGIHANYPISINYPINTYSEGINRENIAVPSLYEYQLNQRLEKK